MPATTIEESNRLAEQWTGLPAWVIKRSFPSAPSYLLDDLHSVGLLALVQAARTFDASRGIKFSTYASRCIWGQLVSYFNRNKRYEDNNSKVTDRIVFDGDFIEHDPADKIVDDLTRREMVDRVLYSIDCPVVRHMVRQRYGIDCDQLTLREIGSRCGISAEAVRQRIDKAIAHFVKSNRLEVSK